MHRKRGLEAELPYNCRDGWRSTGSRESGRGERGGVDHGLPVEKAIITFR